MTPEAAAAEVRRIEITTRHLVRDIVAGEYASAFRGRGVEFAEVREYQPGDDIRSIDWNVTARLGTAYVKRHLEERELTVMFAVDYSASGRFGSRRRAKVDTGLEVVAVLAFAAARSNDRIGALCFTDRAERYIPPRKGRRHALRVVSELLAYDPAGRRTDLAASLGWLETVLRRRSVLFILSDFMTEGWGGALDRLARRHDVVAVRLTDPRERTLPDAGLAAMADPETGAWTWVDTSSLAVREHFARAAAAFDAELERELQRRGADLLALDTTEPYGEALVGFFRRREKRK